MYLKEFDPVFQWPLDKKWFRNYVYIPLGGSRVNRSRQVRNLLAVWALTGLWHGAAWNFVLWGLFYALLLMGERWLWGNAVASAPRPLRHLYALLLIMLGWLIFRSDSLAQIGTFLPALFGAAPDGLWNQQASYLVLQYRWEWGFAVLASLPLQSTYFADSYPSCLDGRQWQMAAIREAFSEAMDASGMPLIDMYAQYEAQGFPKAFYYETDHHYTMRGAFAAYQILMEKINQESGFSVKAYQAEDFQWTALPNRFLGSANRKLYGVWKTSDTLEIVEGEAIPFLRFDNGQPVEASVYSLPEEMWSLSTYGVYMGGDVGETVIQTNRPELPSVLIYGDSFTNPLESLLWRSFNEMRSLDFRYYNEKTLDEYLDEYRPDLVICVRDETVCLSTEGNGATE